MSSFRPASQKFAEMCRKHLESQRVSRVSVKKPLLFFFFKFNLRLTSQRSFVQCSKDTFPMLMKDALFCPSAVQLQVLV